MSGARDPQTPSAPGENPSHRESAAPELSRDNPQELGEKLPENEVGVSYVGHYSGPLPPPRLLAEYDPEVQRIIVDESVQHGRHRMSLEDRVLNASIQQERHGMWLGFILSLSVLFCGTAIILSGSSIEGLALIAADVLAIATVYVQDRRSRPE